MSGRLPRIGVDLGGTKIEAVALNATGKELARKRIPAPRENYIASVRAVVDLVAAIEAEIGTKGRVGVGTPGAISPATGCLKNSNSTWLNGRPLDRDLADALGRPIRMANDADCFALSEATDGAGQGARGVFGVIVGTGTGGGIVIDGKLLAGPNAIAGEWGHNSLPWPRAEELPGPKCYCGKRGCIETFLSGPGMALDHYGFTRQELSAQEIARRAREGDAKAVATATRYVDRMARALAGIINIIDPDVIVLGGGLSQWKLLYDAVPQRWGDYVFSDRVDTRLRPPVHGDAGGVRGAAWLWG